MHRPSGTDLPLGMRAERFARKVREALDDPRTIQSYDPLCDCLACRLRGALAEFNQETPNREDTPR